MNRIRSPKTEETEQKDKVTITQYPGESGALYL